MEIAARLNVRDSGLRGGLTLLLAHGFGCDQTMWRKVVPAFEQEHRVVVFDYVGFGESDLASYDPDRNDRLEAYAADAGVDWDASRWLLACRGRGSTSTAG